MSGYLHSTNPTGLNRRVRHWFELLDQFEHTEAFKAYRAKGYSLKAALRACEETAK